MLNTVMEWKLIESLNNKYEVNSVGDVRNASTQNELKMKTDKEGYVRCYVTIDRKSRMKYAHRLAALAFLDNEENYPVVHHINNKRDDNRIENLMWTTHKYNRSRAFTTCPHCDGQVPV